MGAGVGRTNITDSTTTAALSSTTAAATFVEVSGFTFIKQQPHTNGMVVILGKQGEVGFRFHHNRLFDNGVAGGRGSFVITGYGLIDHVVFDVTDTTASDQMISVAGSSEGLTEDTRPGRSP